MVILHTFIMKIFKYNEAILLRTLQLKYKNFQACLNNLKPMSIQRVAVRYNEKFKEGNLLQAHT